LQNSLISPIIRRDAKLKAVASFVSGVSAPLAAMIERLVVENRIRDLKIFVDYFDRLVGEKLGHVAATVFSVEPLTPSQLKRIQTKMAVVVEPGKTCSFYTIESHTIRRN